MNLRHANLQDSIEITEQQADFFDSFHLSNFLNYRATEPTDIRLGGNFYQNVCFQGFNPSIVLLAKVIKDFLNPIRHLGGEETQNEKKSLLTTPTSRSIFSKEYRNKNTNAMYCFRINSEFDRSTSHFTRILLLLAVYQLCHIGI